MLDVFVIVPLVNIQWLSQSKRIPWSGFPLVFAILLAWWSLGLFPERVYLYSSRRILFDFFALALPMDLTQTCLHRLAHGRLKNTIVGRSHAIHHQKIAPTPEDAFYTGSIDALYQLILPLLAIVQIVKPSRGRALYFGCAYSWWLNFLHSPPVNIMVGCAELGLSPLQTTMHITETQRLSLVMSYD